MNQPQSDLRSDPELTALIEAVLNGQADDSQFDELEGRLSSDASARDLYATYMNVHCELRLRFAVEGDIIGLEAELEREFREGELADFRRTQAAECLPRQPRSYFSIPFTALAAICALVVIGIFVWRQRTSQDAPPTAALAHVRDVEGKVTLVRSTGSIRARIGDALRPDETLRTDTKNARAVLEYADGTTIEVHFDSAIHAPADGDVRLRLLSGSMEVNAAPQPVDHPLIVATDHARYVVVGTRFRLYRSEVATRLELSEGNVQLERQINGRVVETVEIESGNAAVVSAEPVPVKITPLGTGRVQLYATLTATGHEVALAPSGDWLAINDQSRGLQTCKLPDGAPMGEYRRDAGPSGGLAVAPDGKSIVQLNRGGYVQVWQLGETEAAKLPFTGQFVRSQALSANGVYAAQSSDAGLDVVRIDGDKRTLEPLAQLPNLDGRHGKAWSLAFSRDGERLAAGFWDGTLRVYDVASSQTVYEAKLADTIIPVAIADTGRLVAAFTRKDGLMLIDTETGTRDALWSPVGARILSLKFTSDGRCLMAGCSDRTARLWSIADGRQLLVIEANHSPWGMEWIPDRRLLVTADETVKLWECELP